MSKFQKLLFVVSIAGTLLSTYVSSQTVPQPAAPQISPEITAAILEIFNNNASASGNSSPAIPAAPSPATPVIGDTLTNIFPQMTTRLPPRRGFTEIVTPLPVDPTAQPQVLAIDNGVRCTCVPYHMCDPTTQTVRNDGNATTTSSNDNTFLQIDIRFNPDPMTCQHFLDVCCTDNRTRTDSITPRPVDQRPNRASGCGVSNVGGVDFSLAGNTDNESGFGEFPWTVALLHASNHSYFCSGSLIHPQMVLTAAHCVVNFSSSQFLVRAGEWDSQTTKERLPYEERALRRVITHPNYNPRNVANDFALLVLNEAVPIGDHINTVCLPPANLVPLSQQICISNGWGKNIFGQQGRYSAIMKKVPLPIVPFQQCQEVFRRTRLGNSFTLDPSFVCAGGILNVDTCQGDGGAPLACPTGNPTHNRYHQVGIVSWGIGCKDEIPAAYASVSAARAWIDQQVFASGFNTSTYTF